jgi:AcrR family transcriptional regulator
MKVVDMPQPVKKRAYTSPIRQEQAARTRTRILDAAEALFLSAGYARTTVRVIAEQANVAADTVYASFGTKARLLTALIDRRLVPDNSVDNVTERPEAQSIRAERDQRRQLELFADFITNIATDLRPIFEILRTASAVEPEMADVFAEMDRYRLQNMYRYAEWIAARGPLRLDTRRAGETMWVLAGLDVGRMLCDELGWSRAEHAAWLADTIARTLLPNGGEERRRRRGPAPGSSSTA